MQHPENRVESVPRQAQGPDQAADLLIAVGSLEKLVVPPLESIVDFFKRSGGAKERIGVTYDLAMTVGSDHRGHPPQHKWKDLGEIGAKEGFAAGQKPGRSEEFQRQFPTGEIPPSQPPGGVYDWRRHMTEVGTFLPEAALIPRGIFGLDGDQIEEPFATAKPHLPKFLEGCGKIAELLHGRAQEQDRQSQGIAAIIGSNFSRRRVEDKTGGGSLMPTHQDRIGKEGGIKKGRKGLPPPPYAVDAEGMPGCPEQIATQGEEDSRVHRKGFLEF